MKRIQLIKDGYEIVIAIPENNLQENAEYIEAMAIDGPKGTGVLRP